MSTVSPIRAANPRPRDRPARYGVAIAVATTVVIVLVASSILDYVFLDTIPGRTALYGLLAVALVALGTFIGVRAFDRDPAVRRRHFIRAGVLLGLAVLLWLLVIDLYVFTSSAGPGVAAICAAACLPTTAFGLFVVRRLDRNEKEPWRLVLVAFAWGAIVATSMVIWGESLWTAIAERVLVPGPGLDASTAFSAGLLEELAKGAAVLLLFLVMRNEFDDVVDGIQAIAETFVIYGVATPTPEAKRLAAILDSQSIELAAALRKLDGLKDLERHFEAVHELENEADGLSRAAVARLFREELPPIEVIKWRDLYNDFENTIDAAEDAVEAMERMYHKAN